MSESRSSSNVNVTVGGVAFVLWLFFLFWAQSGWYRVDCSLGIEKACALIQDEYQKKDRP